MLISGHAVTKLEPIQPSYIFRTLRIIENYGFVKLKVGKGARGRAPLVDFCLLRPTTNYTIICY